MNYAFFILNGQRYYLENFEGKGMDLLGLFLDIDASTHINFFKDWLNDPWEKQTGGNYSYLKKEGDKVIIGCTMDWGKPDEEVFEITIDELNYILDRWEELCKQKPKEIIITRDNDKITIEGKN